MTIEQLTDEERDNLRNGCHFGAEQKALRIIDTQAARVAELEPEYDRMCLAVLAAEKMLTAAHGRADALLTNIGKERTEHNKCIVERDQLKAELNAAHKLNANIVAEHQADIQAAREQAREQGYANSYAEARECPPTDSREPVREEEYDQVNLSDDQIVYLQRDLAAASARIAELEALMQTDCDEYMEGVRAAQLAEQAANARADAAEQEVTFANNRARQACEDYEGIQKSLTAERAETARLREQMGYFRDTDLSERLAATIKLLKMHTHCPMHPDVETFLAAQPAPAKGEP